MVFKLCVSQNYVFTKCLPNFPIGFNGFQNYVFQSVFKCSIGLNGFQIMCFQIPPQVSMVFKLCVSKMFSNFPIGFKVFSKLCVWKSFQISWFQWFSNYLFESVFKFPHRFHRFQWCFKSMWFSKVFQSFQISL